jgi:hypothetical protein
MFFGISLFFGTSWFREYTPQISMSVNHKFPCLRRKFGDRSTLRIIEDKHFGAMQWQLGI